MLLYNQAMQINHTLPSKIVRYSLGTLLLLVAINAFGGGYYGMSGADAVPLAWLKGSVFHSYFIPSLILFVCVGGTALMAGIAVFKHHKFATKAALIAGSITIGWITVQVAIIGYVSWLQPVIFIVAVIILILTLLLRKYDH